MTTNVTPADQLARNYLATNGKRAAQQKVDRLGRMRNLTPDQIELRAALSRLLGN